MTLTKSPQTDIKRVIAFLEEHNVVCPANCDKNRGILCPRDGPKTHRIDPYKKWIGSVEVEVLMQTELATGVQSVSNAYVVKPALKK